VWAVTATPTIGRTVLELAMTAEQCDPEFDKYIASRDEFVTHDTRVTCPDCKSDMRPITLIDDGGMNKQHKLRYAIGTKIKHWPMSLFMGRYTEAGEVNARMCPSCGRIVLHASPSC
jgi:hypothetical protein